MFAKNDKLKIPNVPQEALDKIANQVRNLNTVADDINAKIQKLTASIEVKKPRSPKGDKA